jgi:hypothetical protein
LTRTPKTIPEITSKNGLYGRVVIGVNRVSHATINVFQVESDSQGKKGDIIGHPSLKSSIVSGYSEKNITDYRKSRDFLIK